MAAVTNTPTQQARIPRIAIKPLTIIIPNISHQCFVTTLRLNSIACQKSIFLSITSARENVHDTAR